MRHNDMKEIKGEAVGTTKGIQIVSMEVGSIVGHL